MVAKFSFSLSYLDEEITHFAAIADVLKKDADANIIRNLGLKWGSAVRFKGPFPTLMQRAPHKKFPDH